MQLVTKKPGDTIEVQERAVITIVGVDAQSVQMGIEGAARQREVLSGIDERLSGRGWINVASFLMFVAVTIALSVWGAPIGIAVACVFGLAAYSTAMGLARRRASDPSPPRWAKSLNFVRECLAHEPNEAG